MKIYELVWSALFVSEFLDKLQSQLDGMKLFAQLDCDHLPKTVTEIFEGSLVSEVS